VCLIFLQKRQAEKKASSDATATNKRTKVTASSSPQKSYYLMKSEADVFSIDDLSQRPNQTEPWDGVRNHQAKKIIQGMNVGDQALFWSSNCKQPGVVGFVNIVKESYPDPTQYDKKSEYYDASATKENPKWFCVDVQLERKLEQPVTLAELKTHAEGALSGMALFRMSRLSVQPVSAEEWAFVLGLEQGKK
jgi:predicted RNA-binding protein with PUA-like domain